MFFVTVVGSLCAVNPGVLHERDDTTSRLEVMIFITAAKSRVQPDRGEGPPEV